MSSSDNNNFTAKLDLFVPMTPEQQSGFIDMHQSITQELPESAFVPQQLECYTGMPTNIDIEAGERDGTPGLYLRDAFGDANIPYVTDLLQTHLKQNAVDVPIGFQWSERTPGADCGDFGGGATVISQTEIKSMTTLTWLNNELGDDTDASLD